jgi:hypothetical protein
MLSRRVYGLPLILALVLLPALPAISRGASPLPSGGEIHVNVSQHGTHVHPLVTVFPDGGFVVVWTNGPADGVQGRSVIHARLFGANGSPASGEFRLTEPGAGSQTADDIAAARDGSFVVTWTEFRSGSHETDVFVRRFRRDGSPVGARVQANDPNPLRRAHGRLAIGPDGRFVAAWDSTDFDQCFFGDAVARRFSADGKPLGGEILLGMGDPGVCDDALDVTPYGLALEPDGTLAVLLQVSAYDQGTDTYLGIYAPRGGVPSFTPLNRPFCCQWNWTDSGFAMAPDGKLIAAWRDDEIRGRRIDAHGKPLGQEFLVPKRLYGDDFGEEVQPRVAALPDGGFVVTWLGPFADGVVDGNDYVYTRVWNADGTPASRDFRLSMTPAAGPPSVSANRKGPVVVVWSRGTDVYARLLTSR